MDLKYIYLGHLLYQSRMNCSSFVYDVEKCLLLILSPRGLENFTCGVALRLIQILNGGRVCIYDNDDNHNQLLTYILDSGDIL